MLRVMKTTLCALVLMACARIEPAAAGTSAAPPLEAGQAEAVFAGGCFWCMEKPFDKISGVLETTSGYTGGLELSPTYQAVSSHRTTHYEAIRIVYNPEEVTYERLLEVFWHNVDPTQANGQFCDRGDQYRTGIFTSDAGEVALAEASRQVAAGRIEDRAAVPLERGRDAFAASDGLSHEYEAGVAHAAPQFTPHWISCQSRGRNMQKNNKSTPSYPAPLLGHPLRFCLFAPPARTPLRTLPAEFS